MSSSAQGDATPTDDDAQQPTDDDAQQPTDDELFDTVMSRRKMMIATGAAVAAASTGSAAAQSTETTSINFDAPVAHDPWINGIVTVDEHRPNFGELQYIADDGSTANLADEGFAIARDPDDETTPHNPVSIKAADFYGEDDDGDRVALDEFAAFPRGTTWDDDADTSTDEVDVSVLDSTHWSVDTSGSAGSASVTDVANGALNISTSSQTSGDTAVATFDLTTAGSSDATITSPDRKFLQLVADVDVLTSGVTVEIAAVDSTGAEAVATIDPAGDATTTSVLSSSTGDSQVGQARIGELATLDDIAKVLIRIKDEDADLTIHGLNLERESEWTFGRKEQTTTDSDGATIVETVDVVEPSGKFSITGLGSLADTSFANAALATVEYDVEMRASQLPDAQIMARVEETSDVYDRPKKAEVVASFDPPTAYSLGISFSNMQNTVKLPQGRYIGAEVATGIAEIEDWEDVEDTISWTSRTSSYGSIDSDVELLASVAASDRTATRHRYVLSDSEADDLVASSSGASSGVVGAFGGGGGSGGFDGLLTIALGAGAGALAFFRKPIMSWLGR